MNRVSLSLVSFISLAVLQGCDQSSGSKAAAAPEHNTQEQARLELFIQQIKSELVYVQGGEFLMGDFGEEHGQEKLPYDGKKDSKPLHKVELSSYSLNKFKVSNKQYQLYLSWNQLKGRVINGLRNMANWQESARTADTPAHVDWNEANQYCTWLGNITGLPFSLPTEAQWEYAARNRGQYVVAPTDDGTIRIEGRKGINIATEDDAEGYSKSMGTSLGNLSPVLGDFRPPNPLGIYDMAGNGWEWMKDWYDPDYYSHSPVKDLQGPGKPVFKDPDGYFTNVLRSQDFSGSRRGLTMVRYNADPESRYYPPVDKTVRCVVNRQQPIK